MLTNILQPKYNDLQKIFNGVKKNSFILSCYEVQSNNIDETKLIEENPCIFACQVELVNLIMNEFVRLDCKIITLYEGMFGTKELIEGEIISLIVNKEKISNKESFNFDKLVLDKLFSFYTNNETNKMDKNNSINKIQKVWMDSNRIYSNCYIQLYCIDNNEDDQNDISDLILF